MDLKTYRRIIAKGSVFVLFVSDNTDKRYERLWEIIEHNRSLMISVDMHPFVANTIGLTTTPVVVYYKDGKLIKQFTVDEEEELRKYAYA